MAQEPRYGGLDLRPQRGLVPLGADPRSGLQEFAHLPSGDVPQRDARGGRLLLTPASGIVLVLIPGGTFRMGAHPVDDAHPRGAPNVDPQALSAEYPVQDVEVDAFFIAKHEMTQAQWQRFTGEDPSATKVGPTAFPGEEVTLMHPVNGVSWAMADRELGRLGLVLPTEAQWEYACRAGTTTPWWTGLDKGSLQGAANLLDKKIRSVFPGQADADESLYDGWITLAPIGTYRANRFGLHDVHGNVAEWCRDAFEVYGWPQGTVGELDRLDSTQHRVFRGGSYLTPAANLRSSHRVALPPANSDAQLGVRPAREID